MSDSDQRGRRGPGSPVDDADREVLERIADGQLDALEELYDRYRTMAYSIAFRITNDRALAEDVVQDGFVGVWRNAARYVEGRGSVKTWLLAIVHHRAIDALRRRRPTSKLLIARCAFSTSSWSSWGSTPIKLARCFHPRIG